MIKVQRSMLRVRGVFWSATLALLFPAVTSAAEARHQLDVVYAKAGDLELKLDLHLPAQAESAPLVVYVHGGAWSAGSKAQYPVFLVEQGFAVASLDFRSTLQAPFPANVHDIKAAIRYLRAHAKPLGYAAEKMALIGASSGGHLAALAGITAGQIDLEGSLGEHRQQSSAVQAIVSFFGASNLTSILAQSTPFGLEVRGPALQRLLGQPQGAAPDVKSALARLASPVFHVDAKDPPLMLWHGDQDAQMPINQSHELAGAYARAGLPVIFEVLHGVGHDGVPFFQGEPARKVTAFLRQHLQASPRN